MSFKLGRKIKKFKKIILLLIEKISPNTYNLILDIKSRSKFSNIIKKINNTNHQVSFGCDKLNDINNFEFKNTSQNNEDGIINYIFSKLQIKKINFVEIGFDYFENNSLNFIVDTKKGLFIDGSKDKVYLLKKFLKLYFKNKNIFVYNIFINKKNINQVLEKFFTRNEEIDFLSIDVDGIDCYLLENLNFKPKVLCIEYNFWFGNTYSCAIPYSDKFIWKVGSTYSGCSISALNKIALKKGYCLVALESNCVNAFFVRKDLAKNFQILDPSIDFKIPKKFNKVFFNKQKDLLMKKKLNFI